MESSQSSELVLEMLAAYVPEDRRQAMAWGEILPEHLQGVALFADISGFTPFTEALVQHHGPQRGAEELTGHLEQIYNDLVQQIHNYRGSVIGYSGDAITCWFDQDDGHRAFSAAIGMQRSMTQRAPIIFPSGKTITLAIKVAIVAGAARRFLVGDPSIQLLDVLGGEIAERLATAAQLVRSGEVLIDTEITRRLAGLLQVSERRCALAGAEEFTIVTGLHAVVDVVAWPDIPPNALTVAQLRPWILPVLYERIRRGHGQFLTELRPTVALFLRFGGIDYEHDPNAPALLNAYIHWVQAVLVHYEGVLLDITLAEKGSYLYATFGAPVVHEDDARRALLAALELRSLPPGLAFIRPVQIGLSLGTMRTGPSGSTTRRTYAVLGDAVNVAARLMEAAEPGEIIATERVIQRVTGLFHVTALPPLKAKGKAQPLSVYRVGGVVEHRTQDKNADVGKMVGREAERAALDAMLERLGGMQDGVVLIEGEAGIGKSRLLGSWIEQAAAHRVRVVIGISDAIERFTPYHGWRSIFAQLFLWEKFSADPAARHEHVLDLLRSVGMEERAPLLGVVLPLELPDNELTINMTGKVRADNTHDVLVALLQRVAAQQPLLLVLEDAHWLDSASWALALTVLRQVSPLLLVLITRPLPNPVPLEYQIFLAQPDVLRLQLLPLSPNDAVALACQRLGVDTLPEQVATLIRERAEGHPFFCEELAYALRDAGVITIVGGKCQISPDIDFQHLALPDTVEGVITSRIDLLPSGQQLAVKVASVIGRMFTYRVLAEVHPVEADRLELADYLDHLQRLDVTPLVISAPDPTYAFKHIITQEVAYNLMLFAQRRQLHRAVAEWYERTFSSDLVSIYPLLAHHWLSASEPQRNDPAIVKAIEYLEKAGEAALRSDANQEAKNHFSRLLTLVAPTSPLAPSVPQTRLAQWEYLLGEAYARLGKLAEAEQHLTQALLYLDQRMPGAPLQTGISFARQITRQLRNRLFGQSPAHHVRTEERLKINEMIFKICQQLALLYFLKHQPELMFYCTLVFLNIADEIGPSPEFALASAAVSTASGYIPLHPVARLYQKLSLATINQLNAPLARAHALVALAGYTAGIGQFERTVSWLRESIATLEAHGVWQEWGVCMEMLVRVRQYQGEFRHADEIARHLFQVSKQRNDVMKQGWSLTNLVELHYWLANDDDTTEMVAEVKRLLLESRDSGPYQQLYATCALVHLQRGEWAAADEEAKQLLSHISNARPTSFGLLIGYDAAATVYLSLWERRALPDLNYLKSQVILSCQLLARYAQILPLGKPAHLRAQGRYAWLSGRAWQAKALWGKSLATAQTLQMPSEEAMTRYELGRQGVVDRSQSQEHLRRARDLFQQMGLGFYEQQVRETQEALGFR